MLAKIPGSAFLPQGLERGGDLRTPQAPQVPWEGESPVGRRPTGRQGDSHGGGRCGDITRLGEGESHGGESSHEELATSAGGSRGEGTRGDPRRIPRRGRSRSPPPRRVSSPRAGSRRLRCPTPARRSEPMASLAVGLCPRPLPPSVPGSMRRCPPGPASPAVAPQPVGGRSPGSPGGARAARRLRRRGGAPRLLPDVRSIFAAPREPAERGHGHCFALRPPRHGWCDLCGEAVRECALRCDRECCPRPACASLSRTPARISARGFIPLCSSACALLAPCSDPLPSLCPRCEPPDPICLFLGGLRGEPRTTPSIPGGSPVPRGAALRELDGERDVAGVSPKRGRCARVRGRLLGRAGVRCCWVDLGNEGFSRKEIIS